ncbi:MAG: MFS transporter [Gillisia sp.]|nr:MFS transporter [Gillisia sp.]
MAVLSILFVYKYVIETKGKTLEEVEELLIK